MQQVRDLLECVWRAVLTAAGSPFRSKTWCAWLAVVLERCADDPQRVRRLGLEGFTAAVRRELPRWQGIRPSLRIVRAVFAALADPHGVSAHRAGALERAGLVLADWQHTIRRLADTEARMVAVPDELGLYRAGDLDRRPYPVGAATILAETGDLTRFHSPRAVVKHAGLCPRDNSSGQHQGKSAISGRGCPALRLAAWRAVWAALPNNPPRVSTSRSSPVRSSCCAGTPARLCRAQGADVRLVSRAGTPRLRR